MKLLLDTHAFIWWDSNPEKLSPHALTLCQDRRHKLIISVASLWEMQIKAQLGKLKLKLPMAELVANQKEINDIQVLPISFEHIMELENLPIIHNDPGVKGTLKISVIVCTHNRCNDLMRTLDSLASQDYPKSDYEVLVKE